MTDSEQVMDWFDSEFSRRFPERTSHSEEELEYLGMNIKFDKETQITYVNQFNYMIPPLRYPAVVASPNIIMPLP